MQNAKKMQKLCMKNNANNKNNQHFFTSSTFVMSFIILDKGKDGGKTTTSCLIPKNQINYFLLKRVM